MAEEIISSGYLLVISREDSWRNSEFIKTHGLYRWSVVLIVDDFYYRV